MPTFVIAGASLAGAKAAETLRDEGFDGEIVLLGTELELPYERPPLSKGYLQGKDERESVFVHPADWYGQHQVDLRLDTPATAIHTEIRTVAFAGGAIAYDKLAITTGAAARSASDSPRVRR
jgi:3-phenylpropionate/trans-cinnamate dioxygenase ferredoxin reductase subunit